MADLNVALILRLVDRATGPARAAMDRMDRLSRGAISRNASQVNRGARLMAGGMGNVAGAATKAGLAMAAYKGVMAGIGLSFVRPAAEMERFNVQLTNLEGSSEGAKKAMAWIQDFATRTPLELNDTIAAYAKLKAFGLDPTQGALQAMVDTMAATGGSAEQLDGLVLALGQAWTKGKLQGEEALQMLERGVPVWDLLAEKLGKTSAQVQEMATKGKLGREEIQLLIDALGARNEGASENMSKTWSGIISNLMDHWSRWQVMVMDAGVFDYLKGKLQVFLDFLNAAAADGRLLDWAEMTAAYIQLAFHNMEALAAGAVEAWSVLYPWLAGAAEWLGGWQNLLIAITGLAFGKTILGFVAGIAKLTIGLARVSRGTVGLLAILARLTGLGTIAAVGGLVRVFAGLGRILAIVGRGLMLNPLGLAIAGIATAVYAIYDNWEGIVSWFDAKVGRIKDAFDRGLINGVFQVIKEFNGFTILMEAATGFMRWANQKIKDAFDIDLYATGVALIQSLWDGVKAKIDAMIAWIKEKLASIGDIDFGGGVSPANGSIGSGGGRTSSTDVMATPAPAGSPRAFGGRALGGPVRAYQAYRWLEEGHEMFMPRTDGLVISNRELKAMRSGGGQSVSRSISLGGITINAAPGMDPAAIARAVRREIERMTRDSKTVLHDGVAYD